jgi:acyl-CoA synthetase (AMP-forming)/AMP-acid ligase II
MHPQRIAVETDREIITYRQLDAMAQRIAASLSSEGARSSAPVALLFAPGIEQVAALLGVLGAGRSFTLLDPSSPDELLTRRLARSDILVTDQENARRSRKMASSRCRIREFDELISTPGPDPLIVPTAADELAFESYSSGSTGEPKTVRWSHRNSLQHVMLWTNAYHLCC